MFRHTETENMSALGVETSADLPGPLTLRRRRRLRRALGAENRHF